MSELALLPTAFLLGAMHVLIGPDHLAALAPFAFDARQRAWVVGLRWGVGHWLGISVVGLSAYALVDGFDIEILERLEGPLVGFVLIAIGLWGLRHLRDPNFGRTLQAEASSDPHVHTGAAFLVGSVHGVAGTASVMGVIPALAQSSWWGTAAYLTSFGLGSIAALLGVAYLLGRLAGGTAVREGAYRWIFAGASGLCLILGVAWIIFGGH